MQNQISGECVNVKYIYQVFVPGSILSISDLVKEATSSNQDHFNSTLASNGITYLLDDNTAKLIISPEQVNPTLKNIALGHTGIGIFDIDGSKINDVEIAKSDLRSAVIDLSHIGYEINYRNNASVYFNLSKSFLEYNSHEQALVQSLIAGKDDYDTIMQALNQNGFKNIKIKLINPKLISNNIGGLVKPGSRFVDCSGSLILNRNSSNNDSEIDLTQRYFVNISYYLRGVKKEILTERGNGSDNEPDDVSERVFHVRKSSINHDEPIIEE